MKEIKAWISKHALTNGIYSNHGENFNKTSFVIRQRGIPDLYFHRNEWHRTPEEALARAEEMRQNKIESLKKQLAKLENMTFTIIGDE